jgi:protein subunit release factor B
MPDFGVRPDKQKALIHRMARLGIRECDIVEDFIHAGGPGGQNVNKTATCVRLKHIPTGIEVKCRRERSQAVNRFLARRLLADEVERRMLGKPRGEDGHCEKARKQKDRRRRRAQTKGRPQQGPPDTAA